MPNLIEISRIRNREIILRDCAFRESCAYSFDKNVKTQHLQLSDLKYINIWQRLQNHIYFYKLLLNILP